MFYLVRKWSRVKEKVGQFCFVFIPPGKALLFFKGWVIFFVIFFLLKSYIYVFFIIFNKVVIL